MDDRTAARRALGVPQTLHIGSWGRAQTRLGTFLVASLDGAIVQTGLPGTTTERFLADLRARHPAIDFTETTADPLLARAATQLSEYAVGKRTRFDLPVRLEGTAFQRKVWDALAAIPFGEVRSYGEVATAIGRPGASRAVGQANHVNPVAPIIPCHRVVTSAGTLGGYGGGMDLKRALLAHEGIQLP